MAKNRANDLSSAKGHLPSNNTKQTVSSPSYFQCTGQLSLHLPCMLRTPNRKVGERMIAYPVADPGIGRGGGGTSEGVAMGGAK